MNRFEAKKLKRRARKSGIALATPNYEKLIAKSKKWSKNERPSNGRPGA